MKKLLAVLTIFGVLLLGVNNMYAQKAKATSTKAKTAVVKKDTSKADTAKADTAKAAVKPNVHNKEDLKEQQAKKTETGIHQQIRAKFIEGGPGFMGVILLSFILGLAIALERIIYLIFSSINTKKFIAKVEQALEEGGIEAAKEVARNTRGPVAAIYYEGLDRYDQGLDVVEKSVMTYGSVQTGLLERGLTWIALFIAIAPMLGFLGTVIGMIEAFDAIEKAGNISATLVAHGIKVALITTVAGLIVAITLQIFYNYISAKIDSLVTEMEDASVALIDMLVKYQEKHSKN